MPPLRQRMRAAMQLRGLAARTQETYLAAVQHLALHYAMSPDRLTAEQLRQYVLFLCTERHLAPNAINVALNAVTFRSTSTLPRPWPFRDLLRPAVPQKLPVVLSPEAVWLLLGQIRRPPYRVCLRVIDSCGRRLRAGVRLPVTQIDRARMQLLMRGGTGTKDRAVPVPPRTLTRFRAHWRSQRTPVWLFPSPGSSGDERTSATVPMEQRGVPHSVRRAIPEGGLHKPATVHSFRHSWATHMRERGVNLRLSQLWLGHPSPTTTAMYTQRTRSAAGPASRARDQRTAGMP